MFNIIGGVVVYGFALFGLAKWLDKRVDGGMGD
jgi:hypothetical protein